MPQPGFLSQGKKTPELQPQDLGDCSGLPAQREPRGEERRREDRRDVFLDKGAEQSYTVIPSGQRKPAGQRGRGAEGPVDSLVAHLFIQPTKGSACKAGKSSESFQNSSFCQAWVHNLLSQPSGVTVGGCKFWASLGYRERPCLQRKRKEKVKSSRQKSELSQVYIQGGEENGLFCKVLSVLRESLSMAVLEA